MRSLSLPVVLTIAVIAGFSYFPAFAQTDGGAVRDPGAVKGEVSSIASENADGAAGTVSSSEAQSSEAKSAETESSVAAKSSEMVIRPSSSRIAASSVQSSQISSVKPVSSSSSSLAFVTPLSSVSSGSSKSSVSSESSVPSSIFDREQLGYHTPVIDPAAIAHPHEISLAPEAVAGNLLLALIIALTVGLSGVILRRLIALDEKRVMQVLRRLPFQAVLTAILIWLIHALIPTAQAQGSESALAFSVSQIPLYTFLFFVIVGTSNYLFNSMLLSEGDRFFSPRVQSFSDRAWFIVLLVLGYGLVGAHINPAFSLFPGRELGIAIIAVLSIIISTNLKDFLLYGLAHSWHLPSRFRASIGGFAVAVVCIVVSRALGLHPGYIYGVPIGLLILASMQREREGLFEFLGVLWALVLATLAWIAGGFLEPYPILFDLSNLLFVILIEDAFFEILPLPYLSGGTIFAWRKLLWVLECMVIVFFLFHTFFNPQGTVMNLVDSPPAAVTLWLLGSYAAGVLLLWGYVVWGKKR